jgi:hypothetical protein
MAQKVAKLPLAVGEAYLKRMADAGMRTVD